jgi:predicted amidohydrolase
MTEAFRLGLCQMYVTPGDKPENLRRAGRQIARAASGGARVVVLPEAMDCGWTHPSARSLASSVTGDTVHVLRAAASRHGVYVCSGFVERGDNGRLYNAAVLIDRQGAVLLHHRKLNELDIAHDLYAQGDRLGIARTPLATFGLMICADAFAAGHVVSRTLGLMGADVILSPSAWAVPADYDNVAEPYGKLWHECYEPVAKEFGLWIAGASNVGPITAGPWAGRQCIGRSLVIGPGGRTVLEGPYGQDAEEVLFVDVRPHARTARGSGWTRASATDPIPTP